MVKFRSFSGTISDSTELKLYFPDIVTGQKIIWFSVSVENKTIIQIKGVKNLNLSRQLSTSLETDGFQFGGDLDLRFYEMGLKELPIITGTPIIIFNQTTGADVNYSGFIIVE